MAPADLVRILTPLVLLLLAAHALGDVFRRFRQPRVMGEITGGLLLGPTVLASVMPDQLDWVLRPPGIPAAVLSFVQQLGLLLLMYCSGAQMRSLFRRGERRTVSAITAGGLVVPFAAGLLAVSIIDTSALEGKHGGDGALVLVFGVAIAVTSIPVISRILYDLGIIQTAFSRIVLGAAVLEDVFLYVVFAIALGLASAPAGDEFGLPAILDVSSTSGRVAYHVVAEIAFIAVALALAPRLRTWMERPRLRVRFTDPIAFELVTMLALSGVSAFLGVVPMFGALIAGLIAGTSTTEDVVRARHSIERFAFAFFIPVYFAMIGLQIDLVHAFDPVFFVCLLVFATATKAGSVYASARLAGESGSAALHFAVAMNARGGPGIVVASAAFDAGIVSPSFFASLVMLALVTSLLAGTWLDRAVRTGSLAGAAADPAHERLRP